MVADSAIGTSNASAPSPKSHPVKLNTVRVRVPVEDPETRTQDFKEVIHSYTLEDAVLEAKRCIQCGKPYCVEACPITQDAREYIRLIAERKFDDSARAILTENPLATTLCKVCYHYCEDACVVGKKGVPIAIRQLKRAGLELGKSDLRYVPAPSNGQRVAVVGGGPAGIMAAWELGLRGYEVTVYESQVRLGGQVNTIPRYRMVGPELEQDLDRFQDLPVHFVNATRVGTDISTDSLIYGGFDAVLLTMGTTEHRSLGIPGEDLPEVYPAFPLLRDVNEVYPPTLGRKILVIGGGDVAMDAARSALRLSGGGEVTVVYRRGRREMPADKDEVHEAEEEGIGFLFQTTPLRILGVEHVEGLELQQTELGPPDASGRRSPRLVPGSQRTIPCDTVIVAVGQRAATEGFPSELGLQFGSQGWPQGAAEDFMTHVEGVFATGGRSVVYAMAAGTKAAEAIDAYLARKRGGSPIPRPDPWGAPTPPAKLPRGYGRPTWHLG